jgi:hypothetical protein
MNAIVFPQPPPPPLRPVDVATDEIDRLHTNLLELADVVLSGVLGKNPERCIAGMLRVMVEESTVSTALALVDAMPEVEVAP